jgi:hypothetical protein
VTTLGRFNGFYNFITAVCSYRNYLIWKILAHADAVKRIETREERGLKQVVTWSGVHQTCFEDEGFLWNSHTLLSKKTSKKWLNVSLI